MTIEFDNNKLAKQFADEKSLKKAFGEKAKGIIARLADLDAADTLKDMRFLPAAQCHELKGELAGYFAVKINPNFRLIFYPTQQPPPILEDGGIDWLAVDAVTITAVIDYH